MRERARPALALVLAALALLVACGGEERRPSAEEGGGRAPGARAGRLMIAWDRRANPRERVLIGTAGLALGPEGGALTRYLFASPERTADARFLFAAFTPFEMETGQGRLRFTGRGKVSPTPAERRMVVEWARLVANEAASGRVGGAYALALAWHRGGAAGGECDDVAVYLTGEARAGSCGWDEELRGRLTAEAIARLYAWFDRYAPFQKAAEEDGAGGVPSRLIFAGQGTAEMPARERSDMERFAAAIHRELAARRPAMEPMAPTSPPESTEPVPPGARPAAPPTPPPAPERAERLLRPPDPAPGRPAGIVVPESALPKVPPPVPSGDRPPAG